MSKITIHILADTGDARGSSFEGPLEAVGFLAQLKDMHLATIYPGHTRGNHAHARKRELILVMYRDAWVFGWDEGENTKALQREFSGQGAVLLEVRPGASHGIRNSGAQDLTILGLSSEVYDHSNPDIIPRKVV